MTGNRGVFQGDRQGVWVSERSFFLSEAPFVPLSTYPVSATTVANSLVISLLRFLSLAILSLSFPVSDILFTSFLSLSELLFY